ncbi:hypothetical protein [Mycobacterium sp. MMS18-G62]
MTATISVVAGSQPDGLVDAAGRIRASIERLEAQIALQQQALAQLFTEWHGSAADAAAGRAEKTMQHQLELRARLEVMQRALTTGGGELSALRAQILNTAAQATSLGGLVSDDGTVQATGTGQLMTPTMATAYTLLLKALLRTFDAVDQATAAALNGAVPQAPAQPSGPHIPPEGTDPIAVKRWWDSLSDADRQRVLQE